MKKNFLLSLCFLFCLSLCLMPCRILASAEETVLTETKTAPKNRFVTVNGKIYYYNSKGQMLKKTWKTINQKKYYFCADGHAATGSKVIAKKRYLFSAKGVLLKNGFKTVRKKTIM